MMILLQRTIAPQVIVGTTAPPHRRTSDAVADNAAFGIFVIKDNYYDMSMPCVDATVAMLHKRSTEESK
jgi:hypothetical protein